MDITDEQLVADYFGGDEKSLEILIGRYVKPIYNFTAQLTGDSAAATDISQDVFMKMWKNLKKFDTGKKFKVWLYALARNASIDWMRKKKALPFSVFDNEEEGNYVLDTLTDEQLLPDKVFEASENEAVVRQAILWLPPIYRMVILLRYNDELSVEEIAQTLGIPANTAKTRLRRAVAMMRNGLKNRP